MSEQKCLPACYSWVEKDFLTNTPKHGVTHAPGCPNAKAPEPECLPECHPSGYLHAIKCPKAMWNKDEARTQGRKQVRRACGHPIDDCPPHCGEPEEPMTTTPPIPPEPSTRKIGEVEKPCFNPGHNPPMQQVFEPGVYEHRCPCCGKTTHFTVRGIYA